MKTNTVFSALPESRIERELSDARHRSMKGVMIKLGLNPESSSASSKLKKFAIERSIDVSRFVSGTKLDLVGRRFGKLTVLSLYGRVYPKQRGWTCKCDCGNSVIFPTTILLNNKTVKHCGCGQYKRGAENTHWTGTGDLSGTYWTNLKRGAAARNFEFSITAEFALKLFNDQGGKCALSGVDIALGSKLKMTASLDRIDSKKGYIESNVQWLHKDVNRLKCAHPEDHLIYWATKIAKHHEHRKQT